MSRFSRRQFNAAVSLALAGSALPMLPACSSSEPVTVGVTGAAGRLGRLVVEALLQSLPPNQIMAIARNTEEDTASLAASGVTVRFADYDFPEQLRTAFQGVNRLLLISSTGGKRVAQHQSVIDAARESGVSFLAYTSFLHADTSPMSVRADHLATEERLAQAGLDWAVLRNGWYTENYEGDVATALRTGEIASATGAGRIAPATRADYAGAAATVLADLKRPSGQIHELAGDGSFTMGELAAEVARQSGRAVRYRDLSEEEYRAQLVARGLPEGAVANMLASQSAIAAGALFDSSGRLSQLIGRPTTPWQDMVAAVVNREAVQPG